MKQDKDFVPYTEALALKELGFDEPCLGFYDGKGYEPIDMKEILKIMEKQLIAKLSLPRDYHEKRRV